MLHVLLVCTGNICRSPIAHGLLEDRTRDLDVEVRSAGTWASGGSPATDEAVSAAGELGIDIAAHRSARFTSYLADWADLILTMTEEQREEVLSEAPEADGKTFTLKSFAATQVGGDEPFDPDVADPLGRSADEYARVAREIQGLIDDIAPTLSRGRVELVRED